MSEWQRDPWNTERHDRYDVFSALRDDSEHTAAHVTPAGAAWLASASRFPRSVLALWSTHPSDPGVLPCGTVFDVVNVPAVFGRRMVDRLWADGPGSGPVALHRGRMLLFTAPGTAHRLPSLLEWEEWGAAVPSLLCHGAGDAVTVPAPSPRTNRASSRPSTPWAGPPSVTHSRAPEPDPRVTSRWVVAPDTRHPWLPGTEVMLWACVRAARSAAPAPASPAPASPAPASPGRRVPGRSLTRS